MFNRGLNSEEIKGFVLNFKQDELYNQNYFIGLLHNETPLRGDRIQYDWYPAGAQTKAESRQIQHTKPLEDCVYDFSAGSIEKHYPVKMLMSDKLQDVPHAVRKLQPDADGQLPSLGAIFNAIIYQQQTTVDVLRAIAEDHPEQLEEMKELTMRSSVDEEKRKEFTALLDDVMAAVERNTSNSNG
jgi:hypothetical protein